MSKLNLNVIYDLLEEHLLDQEDLPRKKSIYSSQDWDECEQIRTQYERAISRTSTYVCRDLASHIYEGHGEVYKHQESYLVGVMFEDIFVLSHFAPKSLREGMAMMKHVAYEETQPMVLAVPHRQAKMALRCGWDLVGLTVQRFGNEMVPKVVLCNRALSNDKYWTLYEQLRQEAALRKPKLP